MLRCPVHGDGAVRLSSGDVARCGEPRCDKSLNTVADLSLMPRCRDCQWWNGAGKRSALCMVILMRHNVEGLAPDSAMVPGNYDGPSLITGPDFGCVQFKAKA